MYVQNEGRAAIFSAASRSFLDISVNTKYFSSLLISNLPSSAVLAIIQQYI
jgi:hypothetical protein